MLAIGDCALVEDPAVDELRLFGGAGALAVWRRSRVSFVMLADPPRLAILERDGARRSAVVVDVATGAEQTRIHLSDTDALLAFDSTGALLLGTCDHGVEAYDAITGVRIFSSAKTGAFSVRADHVACSTDDDAAVDHEPRALVWSRRHSVFARLSLLTGEADAAGASECRHGVVDGSVSRALFEHEGNFQICFLDERENENGVAGQRARPRTNRYPLSHWPVGALRMLWCPGKLVTFGVVTKANSVHTFRLDEREHLTRDIGAQFVGKIDTVDFAARRVLVHHDRKVKLFDVEGHLLAEASALRACIAAAGVAVALAGGAMRRMGAGGAVETLEGPSDVVDIGPHPRGVLALDAGGRVHVVEVSAGAA